MTERIIFAVFTIFFSLAVCQASAQTATDEGIIGTILEIQGSATVQQQAAVADMPVHMNDVIQTGADSRVFILFIDNTELTLSGDTKLKIDDYIFDPEDNQNNKARYSVLQGAFQYVSGLIGKKDNPDVEIETPVGSIGIRGTDFWAGNLDGQYSVAVNEGQVALKTDGGEEIVNKGQGTSVPDRRSRPARAKTWKQEKLQRMASTVHLQRREIVRQRVTKMQAHQQTLRNQYKNYLKANRRDGQWQKQRPQEDKWKGFQQYRQQHIQKPQLQQQRPTLRQEQRKPQTAPRNRDKR